MVDANNINLTTKYYPNNNTALFSPPLQYIPSTGIYEALELRDGDKANYMGKGVSQAVDNVNNKIAPALIAKQFNVTEQSAIDNFMLEMDGTEHKKNLGGCCF